MPTTVTRRYHFESAHWLPKVPETHKCSKKHGHNYEMEITCGGDVDNVGFIIDFWDLDTIIKPFINEVDHRMLNEVEGLENPTAELIARWFFDGIDDIIKRKYTGFWLQSVRIDETKDCSATYTRGYDTEPVK